MNGFKTATETFLQPKNTKPKTTNKKQQTKKMITAPATGTIKEIFEPHKLDDSDIMVQKFSFTENELYRNGKLRRRSHTLPIQAVNEGVELLKNLKPGDTVEITVFVNGRQKVGTNDVKRYADLRLYTLRKLF
jgi:hypothetical protein